MWRDYFKFANIDGFDYDKKLINKAKRHNLKKVNYHYINVNSVNSISDAFKKTKKKYIQTPLQVCQVCKQFFQ